MTVKQTQKVEGRVGLFRVPVDVEITNATGPKLFPVVVTKESETFTFPSESAPQMVLFDKGNQVLKSIEFKKEKKELLYQLKNATEVADRADAAVALAKLKKDDEVAAALGESLRNDKAVWSAIYCRADAWPAWATRQPQSNCCSRSTRRRNPGFAARSCRRWAVSKTIPLLLAKLESVSERGQLLSRPGGRAAISRTAEVTECVRDAHRHGQQ